MKLKFQDAVVELYRRAATDLPKDVERALFLSYKKERGIAKKTIGSILKNAKIARRNSTPICQDTGTPIFFVKYPEGASEIALKKAIISATKKATKKVPLRPNAVDSLAGENSKDNTGDNFPSMHFSQWKRKSIEIHLMLKGGGSENVGKTYSLPNEKLGAERDLEGVKKCALDAVFQAQGKGCAPGILGISIGGMKHEISFEAKKQLLRNLRDTNRNKKLAKLEKEILQDANKLGIGPMGFGGKTTLLGVKASALYRAPASFFVEISYSCWATRRKKLKYLNGVALYE